MSPREARAFWALLSAVDPRTKDASALRPLSADARLLRTCAELAWSNGLYSAFLARAKEAGLALPSTEDARRALEREATDRFARTIELVADAARASDVEHLIIKNAWAVEHVPRDVDVFVPSPKREALVQELRARGLELAYHDEAEISLARADLLRIDVYSRIHYLGRDFLDDAFLRDHTQTASSIGVEYPSLAPEPALLLNSAHTLFGHGAMSLLDFLDQLELRTLMTDPDACTVEAAARGWGRVFELWTARVRRMQHRIYEQRVAVRFPARHGTRFILDCVEALDGPRLDTAAALALRMSLAMDDLIFVSERAGLGDAVRRSTALTGAANAAGHRLRILRGDRKGLYADSPKRRWERSQSPAR